MKTFSPSWERGRPRPLSYTTVQLVLLCLTLSLLVTSAGAQDLDNVTITGQVTDQNGAAIPGATIAAILIRTGARRTTQTDREGRYQIIQLEPGVYQLRASAPGFATWEKTELSFVAGTNAQLDPSLLLPGIVVDPVVVTAAETPAVDTMRTVVGGTVTTHEVESLPVNSRSPLDLIFTLPGVSEEALSTRDLAEDRDTPAATTPEEAGTFSLAGGPAYSNNITIDGLDNNDDRAARERFQPSLEAVAEVQIITNQFSAEYGRASGGRINIRTQGGSTSYRGRAFYFFRDDWLNANTFNNNRIGISRLPFTEHNPGFTLSGPLRLPKLVGPLSKQGEPGSFFFAAYEYDTILDSALTNTFVPVQPNSSFALPAPTAPASRRLEQIAVNSPSLRTEIAPFVQGLSTPQRSQILTTRSDHNFGERHNGSLLLQFGRLRNLRQFGGGDRLAAALQANTRGSEAISYTDNYVFSAQLVNQARVQFSRLTPALIARGRGSPVVLIDYDYPAQFAGDTSAQTGTLVAGSSTTNATDRRESRLQFQEIFAYLSGAHSLKLGGDLQRIKSTFIDLSDASGTFNFASAGDFLAGVPSRFRQNFQTSSTQRNTYLGFFVQDELRLRANLMVSFGLRWEAETILPDHNNFGPRVAAAYDPFSSGKTVIRLGAGIFYNRALLRTIDDFTLGSQQQFFDTNDLFDPNGRASAAEFQRQFIKDHLDFPNVLTPDSALVQQFGLRNTSFSRRLDPKLRIPESYQANAGMEREIGSLFVVAANYTWNRGLHLWREFNVNAPRLPAGYRSFAEYLAARDFANFRGGLLGARPIYGAANAGDLVRFTSSPLLPANPNAINRITEFGVPISVFNLNSFSSATVLDVALAALNRFRPDPARAEVEQLIAVGNSFYHGLSLELRRRFRAGKKGFGFSFRAAYTLSHLEDDGIVNTSDALTPGDFAAERARSLLDRRHRFVFSGTFDLPRTLGKVRLAPILRLASGAPFNISLGGADRNLDDVGNDRPVFTGDTRRLRWRARGTPLDPSLLSLFSLPTIGGAAGNLPRNAGHGPGQFFLDLNVTREFRLSERLRLRPTLEVDNLLNKTVFSFGSEFINFNAFAPTATELQRQNFLDTFLVATRTLRPRQLRLGVRFDF
jgi:hypothetical protein